ncbi:MAG: hypothetical protein ACYCPQ_01275 [Elusimicrobiota bacterium]
MKKAIIPAVALALAGAIGAWAQAPVSSAKSSPAVTVQGEVLDLSCYLSKGYHGKKHAMCARECLKGGTPAGLLTADGSIYLLAGHGKAYSQVRKMGAETVNVTGKKVSKGGLAALLVEKVSKVR